MSAILDIDSKPASSTQCEGVSEGWDCDDYPKALASEVSYALFFEVVPQCSHAIAHILIHFLLTGQYQSLKPQGSTTNERLASEFSACVEIYVLTRTHKIEPLEELSKCEMERMGAQLDYITVLNLVQNAYPNPDTNDIWFCSFLKSSLQPALTHSTNILERGPSNNGRQSIPMNELIIKTLAELTCDRFVPDKAPDETQSVTIEESAFIMPCPESGSMDDTCPAISESLHCDKSIGSTESEWTGRVSDLTGMTEDNGLEQANSMGTELAEDAPVSDDVPSHDPADQGLTRELEVLSHPLSCPEPGPDLGTVLTAEKKMVVFQFGEPNHECETTELSLKDRKKQKKKEKEKERMRLKSEKKEKTRLQSEGFPVPEGTFAFKEVPVPKEVPAPEEPMLVEENDAHDWTLCEPEAKEQSEPVNDCKSQEDHMRFNGWRYCFDCRDFIIQASQHCRV